MPNLHRELEKCKHPNSRKAKVLGKLARRQNNKQKSRHGHAMKSNIVGMKLNWFLEQIGNERKDPLTTVEFEELINLYLKRFDDELEQISIKQSISKNRANQHVARQDIIRLTIEKERNEYYGGGMELVNLCDPIKLKSLMDWNGSAVNVQHIKLDLISYNMLQRRKQEKENDSSSMQTN